MDPVIRQVSRSDETHSGGLPAGAGCAAEQAGGEADGELLTDLAVIVGRDMAGVGVDPDKPGRTVEWNRTSRFGVPSIGRYQARA
jgi:hypothetical protein